MPCHAMLSYHIILSSPRSSFSSPPTYRSRLWRKHMRTTTSILIWEQMTWPVQLSLASMRRFCPSSCAKVLHSIARHSWRFLSSGHTEGKILQLSPLRFPSILLQSDVAHRVVLMEFTSCGRCRRLYTLELYWIELVYVLNLKYAYRVSAMPCHAMHAMLLWKPSLLTTIMTLAVVHFV